MDMNLLVALDALLAEGSVTGAAERLQLSVPAMSRTLDRVRRMMGDPLFVRAGRGLVPTPRAEALREPVRALVAQAQELLAQDAVFDLGTLRRVFTIRADDGAVSTLGPALLDTLAKEAPRVTVRFISQGKQDVLSLREGAIDLDIGVIEDMGPEIVRQRLFPDRFIAVFRPTNPLARHRKLTPERFAKARHATVSRRGVLSGPVDIELGKAGLARHISTVTHSFAEALAITRNSDLVATVPDLLTLHLRDDLVMRALPFETPAVTISQAWHPRFNEDPAHRAIRQMVHRISQAISGR